MSEKSGQIIDQYRLLQFLGEGAAGEVYLATPTKGKPFADPGDPLAIKLYKSEILRQKGQRERIQKEFRVGYTLSHPNLVRMHEYSPGGNKTPPFLVMEYVDGITLDEWLHMFYPISGRLLLRIVDQLIDAVATLHEYGTIHRDVKPENIMLSSTFDAKIMDFGVIKITPDPPITPDDKFLGSIRNSSPEMLFGRKYDQCTDLYSLGTVFYHLLYGERIFPEEDQFARLVDLVKTEVPHFDPSVSSRDEVSATILELTKLLLQKEPQQRPSSAAEVRNHLDPIRAIIPPTDIFEPLHGYIATALTGLDIEARHAIAFTSSKIAEVAKEYQLYMYQPRKATDPLLHPDVDPAAVYMLDRKRVVGADVLFVLANQPSFGVGQELEIASTFSKPTILICREQTRVSRMVKGSFANFLDEIVYASPEDLARKLRRSLSRNLDTLRECKRKTPKYQRVEIGQQLARLRAQAGYKTPEELANALGISARVITAVERGEYENIGLQMLSNISRAVGVSVKDLFDPSVHPRPAGKVNGNLLRLDNLAINLGWTARDYIELRDDYLKQVAASGEPLHITDDQWRARRSALEQRRFKETQGEEPDTSRQPRLV